MTNKQYEQNPERNAYSGRPVENQVPYLVMGNLMVRSINGEPVRVASTGDRRPTKNERLFVLTDGNRFN